MAEQLAGPLRDRMEGLAAAIDALAGVDADTLTVDEAARMAEEVERERNRLDAVRASLLGSFARRDGFRQSGHKNLAHWMQDRLRRSATDARRESTTAERLTEMADTSAALRSGDISLEHATEIADAAAKAEDPADTQRDLLAAARNSDPRRVRRQAQRRRREADRRAEQARAVERARQQRGLSFHADEAARTMWVKGRLPLVPGAKAKAALEALAAPAGRDDDRTHRQRMADALSALVDRAAGDASDQLPAQGGLPAEVTAVVPVEAIETRAGLPAGTLSGVGDLSHPELDELLGQARLSWLITDPDGVPLHYGRARRFATGDQRRVLAARDGGCRWPGCDSPARWTVAHHEPPFDDDGATDLTSMLLLCGTHHNLRHKAGWTITVDADATVTATSPDGGTVLTETAAQARARHDTLQLHDPPGHHAARDADPPRACSPRGRSGRLPPRRGTQTGLDLPTDDPRAGHATDHSATDHSATDHTGTDHTAPDHSATDHPVTARETRATYRTGHRPSATPRDGPRRPRRYAAEVAPDGATGHVCSRSPAETPDPGSKYARVRPARVLSRPAVADACVLVSAPRTRRVRAPTLR